MALKSAVFIDKDGTLIEDVPFNVNPDEIRLMPGAAEALSRLVMAGYELYVISNQPGVAMGKFTAGDLSGVEERIRELLEDCAGRIKKFYWCTHASDQGCVCRKPEPGMFFQAAAEQGIDLRSSWMIGDILHDVEAGHRAGCRSILVENGNETEWQLSPAIRVPDYMAKDLEDAVAEILCTESWSEGGAA
ncbi:MAG: D-glycero-alpha-D-manno-heptose-1,7-bisphosphate 7-phosphatase [Bdellovibrionia bacterium]